ncbi:MAG: family 16 glycoside hydrolase [Isosphaeraceae bacterium]
MLRTMTASIAFLFAFCCAFSPAPSHGAPGDDKGWIPLTGDNPLAAWRTPTGGWFEAGDARIDPKNARKLVPVDGKGVILNGRGGRTTNLFTRDSFGDVEVHFEFLVPKGSNSGVKFEALYEIQIVDSHGVARPKATHSGGIYPRAELRPSTSAGSGWGWGIRSWRPG